MSPNEVVAKVDKLQALTVERGATPAEAATAASRARCLIRQIAHSGDQRPPAGAGRNASIAPGVHVDIVSRFSLRSREHDSGASGQRQNP